MMKLNKLESPVKRWFDEVPIAIGIRMVSAFFGMSPEAVPIRIEKQKMFRNK